MPTLEFRIDATRPSNRRLWVVATYSGLDQAEVEFFMPTWTPGSYLLREYSRHLSRVEAFASDDQRALSCRKASKNRFVIATDGAETLELRYRVYAHELSVRTADVDSGHAYWNHACVLLWPVNQRSLPARITVDYPAEWSLTCSLEAEAATAKSLDAAAITLRATDLDHALDAPVLVGTAQQLDWEVHGVPHSILLDGLDSIAPPATLVSDLARIVEQASAVFGDTLPYERYLFLALFTGEGYGGLEHRDSTTLLMPRTSLTTESGYQDFLALAAHELFHAWNVKRMRPVEFWEYDYEQENYTKLLWLMEGWTAYYDDLLLVRAGLTTKVEYLASMAKNVQNMRAAPGRFELSLEESSFDAWIRLYRPDENTRNSSQNYYGNGAVAAMCLDLLIRRTTDGTHSLDKVLESLYRTTFTQGRGYEVADVYRVIEEIAGSDVVERLRELVTGPLNPKLDDLLSDVGVKLKDREAGKPFLGVGFRAGTTVIASVTDGSPADACRLAPEDELLAVANLRVKPGSWQTTFAAVAQVDKPVELLIARRGVVRSVQATPSAGPGKVKLVVNDAASDAQRSAGTAWMGEGRST
ncbi:MAG: putative metalloprotease with PDZ domain [Planctomycetota bacterium]